MNFFEKHAAQAAALGRPVLQSNDTRKTSEGSRLQNNAEARGVMKKRKHSNGGNMGRNNLGSAGHGSVTRSNASRLTKKRVSYNAKRRSLKSASYTSFQFADRLVDPDLLIEPERLGVQMVVPTGGRFIHFLNGLRVRRLGNIENPIEIMDRQQNDREKKMIL